MLGRVKSKPRVGNDRQTRAAIQQGTKQMYELLHETEHRILAVQAGGSYLSHVHACKVTKPIHCFQHETYHYLQFSLCTIIMAASSKVNSSGYLRTKFPVH